MQSSMSAIIEIEHGCKAAGKRPLARKMPPKKKEIISVHFCLVCNIR